MDWANFVDSTDTAQAIAQARQDYAHCRAHLPADLPPGTPLVLLHLGAQDVVVVLLLGQGGDVAQPVITLPLGVQRVAQRFFRQSPPTLHELDPAIQTVEDELDVLRPLIRPGAWLCSRDPALWALAPLTGLPDGDALTLEVADVERLFDRFSQVVFGCSWVREALPPHNTFAATLLVLREFMHHLPVGALHLRR